MRLSLALFLALCSAAGPAQAYKLMGPRWAPSSLPIAWQIDPQGSADISDGSDVLEVKRAAQAWADVSCTTVAFAQPANLTGPRKSASDRLNKVFWVEDRWNHGSATLGVTLTAYSGSALFDADIEFNGVHYAWQTGRGAYCSGCTDVYSIALHELGHFLGLDHSTSSDAIMFASYPGSPKQALTNDDNAGICALYPAAGTGTGAQQAYCQNASYCLPSLTCATPKGETTGVCTSTCSGPGARCPSGTQCLAASQNGTYACFGEAPPGGSGGAPGAEGEACDSGCQAELVCVGTSAADGRCRKPCTPGPASACPAYFECKPVQNGSGVCMPSGTPPAPRKLACEVCGRNDPCEDGLVCAVDPDGMSRCRTGCETDAACEETASWCVSREGVAGFAGACVCPGIDPPRDDGDSCLKSSECREGSICINDRRGDGAVCRARCSSDVPTCAPGLFCEAIGAAEVCTPQPPEPEIPESGCDCASGAAVGWIAIFGLFVRRRR